MILALGLDLGEKRIGVAGCDRLGLFATGLTTIHRQSFAQDMQTLQGIIQSRNIQILIVGLPYRMDGTLGAQARRIQKLATRISQAVDLPMEYMDERLTSYEAEQLMRSQGQRTSAKSGVIDRKAAAIILQQWLDQKRQEFASHAKMSVDS